MATTTSYLGFANLPNQVQRKFAKKGFEFNLMVVGESGLGKTTLLNIIRYSIIGPYKGREQVRNYKDQQKSRRPMFDRDYFKNRMQVPLNEAEVEVVFSIANDTFITKHSLYSNRLISFRVNEKKEEEKEKSKNFS